MLYSVLRHYGTVQEKFKNAAGNYAAENGWNRTVFRCVFFFSALGRRGILTDKGAYSEKTQRRRRQRKGEREMEEYTHENEVLLTGTVLEPPELINRRAAEILAEGK